MPSTKRKAPPAEPNRSSARIAKRPKRLTPLPPTRTASKGQARAPVRPPYPSRPQPTPLTSPPSQKLNIYVCGTGAFGELGLGSGYSNSSSSSKKSSSKGGGGGGATKALVPAKRPVLNTLLDAGNVGVVQIAVGGMHCVALTHDQKILTWGVNDCGALGRETEGDGDDSPSESGSESESHSDSGSEPDYAPDSSSDSSSSSSSSSDEADLNPRESTPLPVRLELLARHAPRISQVVATDSASFALTADGAVYGWGTFSGDAGPLGLREERARSGAAASGVKDGAGQQGAGEAHGIQRRPVLVARLRRIVRLAAGANHVLALDAGGVVLAWGCGQQGQLGRRIVARFQGHGLTPEAVGLVRRHQIREVACGAWHSFAVDVWGRVYGWGLNNYGQTGVVGTGAGAGAEGLGGASVVLEKPTLIASLGGYNIVEIKGGAHHSIARADDGTVLVWGRCDDAQMGIPMQALAPRDLVLDHRLQPRILTNPAAVPGIVAVSVAAGVDDSMAVDEDGTAYAWGFSADYRTGLGTEVSVQRATRIESKDIQGKKLSFAACGGQFSVLAGIAPKKK